MKIGTIFYQLFLYLASKTNFMSIFRWKVYESALAIVGAVSTELLVHVQESSASESSPVFDLSLLFSSIVPTYLASSG